MAKKKMGKRQLKLFQDLINIKIQELREQIKIFEETSFEESRDLTHLSHHIGDIASINADIDQSFRLAGREGVFLKHLEEALFRIKQGDYGQCKVCKELISEERLKSVLVAKMCVECKQAQENKKV